MDSCVSVFAAGWMAISMAGLASGQIQLEPAPNPSSLSLTSARASLNQYCTTCHNSRLKTAGLAIDALDINNASHSAET